MCAPTKSWTFAISDRNRRSQAGGSLLPAFQRIVLTAWVGGTWCLGLLVAPTLFSRLPDHRLAGDLAGALFTLGGRIGLGCAAVLLAAALGAQGWQALRRSGFWLLVALAGLTALGLFGVAPVLDALRAQAFPREVMQTVLRDRFAMWHGVSSVLYLIQCGLGGWLVTLAWPPGRG